ncbi:hypothetical protein MMC18_001664 [Xylographa bjoerkii]|nr:hypothetical protein [Xylographa bjoerkii]
MVLRGADQFRTPLPQSFLGPSTNGASQLKQARSLALKEQPAPETVRWMQEMDKSFPAARSAWCMFRTTQISATAAELLSLEPRIQTVRDGLFSLLRDAQDIESEYAHWQDGADPRWEVQAWNLEADQPVEVTTAASRFDHQISHRYGESLEKPIPSQRVLTYTSFWFSNVWNAYRSTRCVLHEIILRIARHLKISAWPTGNIEKSTLLVEELLDETCDSIAYTTGDVQVDVAGHLQLTPIADPLERQGSAAGAYFLLWPLYRVVVCPIATRSQIKTATDTLLRIGQKFGMQLAFGLADMGCK